MHPGAPDFYGGFLLDCAASVHPVPAMKALIQDLLNQALQQLVVAGVLPNTAVPLIERARDSAHGDFASNLALVHSKAAGMKPRDLAERIVAALPQSPALAEVAIAGPGFINFRLSRLAYLGVVP
ncbi:MAG: arginyl-tRNA synthetase, partial [Pseudomonadota bacterium]